MDISKTLESKDEKNKPNKEKWVQQIEGDTIKFTLKLGEFLAKSDKDGKYFRDALTTSQLRNFFGEMKRIQMKLKSSKEGNDGDLLRDMLMLRPKLAYAEARVLKDKRGSKIKEFVKTADTLLEAVDNAEDKKKAFDNFVNIIEAIVAYHKANGGRD
jgi:CRISPR-associated protein Csm2